jgi:hypothetical protein
MNARSSYNASLVAPARGKTIGALPLSTKSPVDG